jgi:MFS family permease
MSEEPIADTQPAPPWAATFRSLRHRNYRLYFIGQMVSLIGTWMQTTVLAWLAFDLTKESKWPSFLTAAQVLPTLLLGAWAGTIADRWPKRLVLMFTQAGLAILAALLAVLVWFGRPDVWLLLAITTASGIVIAVDLPARLAFVMDLVGGSRDDLMNAVALNSVLFNTARIIGPVIGVEVMFWFGPAACFGLNALSYLAVIVALGYMDVSGTARAAEGDRGLRALGQGFAMLFGRPRLLLLVIAAAVTAGCGWPFLTLLPALAADALHMPERGYGFMVSATGAGALTAALTVATLGNWDRRKLFIGGGIALVCLGLIGLSGVTDAGLRLSMASFFLLGAGMACSALIGFGLICFFATCQSVVQLSADTANRGRIMGIWAMSWSGAMPLGNLLVGPAADLWGVATMLLALGLGLGSVALVLLLLASSSEHAEPPGRGASTPGSLAMLDDGIRNAESD